MDQTTRTTRGGNTLRDAAIRRLDATPLRDGRYAYYADETDTYYIVSSEDLEDLGAMLSDVDVDDAYSLWCSGCGVKADHDALSELGVEG